MKRIMTAAIILLIIALLLSPHALTIATGEERSRGDERDDGNEREEDEERDGANGGDERDGDDGGDERDEGDEGDRRRSLGNPPPPPDDDDEPRVLSFTNTTRSVTVVSSGKTDGNDNSYYFTVEHRDGIIFHYDYFRQTGSERLANIHRQFSDNRSSREERRSPDRNASSEGQESASSPQELGLSIAFSRLYEFNETERDASRYDLSRASYSAPKVNTLGQETNPTGLEIHLQTTDGVFGLTIRIFANYTSKGGIVGPLEVKFDITIQDYPFAANDSFLALDIPLFMPEVQKSLFCRELPGKNGENGTGGSLVEDGVGYERDAASLFVSWATNVTVDGEEHNVSAEYSRTLGRNRQFMDTVTFIYPAGSDIFHDPKLGASELIDGAEDTTESTLELLLTWSTGLVAGIATIFAVGRKLRPPKYHWEE